MALLPAGNEIVGRPQGGKRIATGENEAGNAGVRGIKIRATEIRTNSIARIYGAGIASARVR